MAFYNGVNQDTQSLLSMINGPMYSKICIAAIELDVFSLLATPQTAEVLAEKQNWHAGNTELFLNAVASLGLLEKKSGVYRNGTVADKNLVRGKPDFIGDYIVEYYLASRYDDANLPEMVRNGPPEEISMPIGDMAYTDIADKMRSMQLGGRSVEIVEILRSIPEYEGAKKLLDLGCGTGIIGISAVQAHGTMHGVLYDMPNMGDAIQESIRLLQAQCQAQFMGGNYLTDAIGSAYDIVLAVGTLNFAMQSLVPLLEKVHAALNEGGVMICVGDGIHSEGTRPKDTLSGWLVYGLRGMDYRMPRGFIADAALKAGFHNVQTLAGINTYMGTMDIDILRK